MMAAVIIPSKNQNENATPEEGMAIPATAEQWSSHETKTIVYAGGAMGGRQRVFSISTFARSSVKTMYSKMRTEKDSTVHRDETAERRDNKLSKKRREDDGDDIDDEEIRDEKKYL